MGGGNILPASSRERKFASTAASIFDDSPKEVDRPAVEQQSPTTELQCFIGAVSHCAVLPCVKKKKTRLRFFCVIFFFLFCYSLAAWNTLKHPVKSFLGDDGWRLFAAPAPPCTLTNMTIPRFRVLLSFPVRSSSCPQVKSVR